MERTILHCDMNNFYASVACFFQPDLRGKPVAVGGDAAARHGIILAKNEIAKTYGVQTGEALWQAKQKCKDLIIVPPHFDWYLRFSRIARHIYSDYTDQVESFGLDECWLDLSASTRLFGDGQRVADVIRRRIKAELGITVSIGVSFNKIFAKLGSDMKKPDATTVILPENYQQLVWPLPVSDLLFVGPATAKKLSRYGIQTIGALARSDKQLLQRLLGKNGLMLHAFANGHDTSPVAYTGAAAVVKSIGNSTTTPRDLTTPSEVRLTLLVLAESVAARLREQGLLCQTVQITIRDKDLFYYERQATLDAPTNAAVPIADKAFSLYQKHHISGKPIRTLGVRGCNLTTHRQIQLSFLSEAVKIQRQNDLELAIDQIRRRFGHFSIQRAVMLADPSLSQLNPKDDHIIHPEPFWH